MALQQNLGRAIQQLRKDNELSQEQLALKADIDRRYMSDVENGKRNISLDILERLASGLNVSVSYLLHFAEVIDKPQMTIEDVKNWLCENAHENSIVFENPDYIEAILGCDEDGRVIYSYERMIECLFKTEGMKYNEAVEFIDFNTIRSLPYMGDKAPIIMYEINQ